MRIKKYAFYWCWNCHCSYFFRLGISKLSVCPTIGDKVDVLYDPQNPRKASLNSFGALWGFPALLLILGLIFTFDTFGNA
jgi:hypothetical protein